MTDYHPYPDRKEHDYIGKATVLLARQRLIIKQAIEVTDDLQRLVEGHIVTIRERVRKEDEKEKEN